MGFFETGNTAINFPGYPLSYVELIGTLFGLISVYLATRASILTWPTGIVNEVFLFLLFFQIQLYADMFLQVYFLAVTIYGWYNWHTKTDGGKIARIKTAHRFYWGAAIVILSVCSGFLFSNIHWYCPQYFKIPAAYPYTDSLVMVLSIMATVLLAKKKIENWYLWVMVDVIGVMLYWKKGVYFLSVEYLVFLMLALYGGYNWQKQLSND